MAHFPILEYDQLTNSQVKAIYKEIQVELGFGIVPNLVISFGIKAAVKPHVLTAKDYQRLRELGLDDSEIFEIVATADLFTSINKYTDAVALEVDTL